MSAFATVPLSPAHSCFASARADGAVEVCGLKQAFQVPGVRFGGLLASGDVAGGPGTQQRAANLELVVPELSSRLGLGWPSLSSARHHPVHPLQRKPRSGTRCRHLEPGVDQAGDFEGRKGIRKAVEVVDPGGVLEAESVLA
jgi:hypothetical protein